VAVKIKLKRLGKIRQPQYRIIVADARTKRDGRAIEEIGLYHPKEEPSRIEIDSERAQYWLAVGAQPTEPVAALLKITGDWQKFRGLPGAEGTLRTKAGTASKADIYNSLLAEAKADTDAPRRAPRKAAATAVAEQTGQPAGTTPADPTPADSVPAPAAPVTEQPAGHPADQA
jgi:small subunit ribosomal protein S16